MTQENDLTIKKKWLMTYSGTDIGKQREVNEDSVAAIVLNCQSSNDILGCAILVVADGIARYEMGEIASKIATNRFLKEVITSILLSEKTDKINFSEILLDAIKVANTEIWKLSEQKASLIGTTLVGAIIINNRIYIANVGDSRAYLIKPNMTIRRITRDHTAAQHLVNANKITEEQARDHPKKNILTRALGLEKEVIPDLFEEKMEDDKLLLCSDGLYNMVTEDEIARIINGDIFDRVKELIFVANNKGGWDNISVALAQTIW